MRFPSQPPSPSSNLAFPLPSLDGKGHLGTAGTPVRPTSSLGVAVPAVDTLCMARPIPRFGSAEVGQATEGVVWSQAEAKALATTVYRQELQDQYTVWSYETLEEWWALQELQDGLTQWVKAHALDTPEVEQSDREKSQIKAVRYRWIPQVIEARQALEKTLAHAGWDMATVTQLLEPESWDQTAWPVAEYLVGGKHEKKVVDEEAPKAFQEAVWRGRILTNTIETTLTESPSAELDLAQWTELVLDQAPVSVMDVMERVKAMASQEPWKNAPVYDDPSMPHLSEDGIFQAIADGDGLPTQGHYWMGLLQVGEDGHLAVKTDDSQLKTLVKVWDETLPAEAKAQIPQAGLPLSVLVQGGIKAQKDPTLAQEAKSYVPFTQEEDHTNLLFEFINGPLADVYGEESHLLRELEEEAQNETPGFFRTLIQPLVWLKNGVFGLFRGVQTFLGDAVSRLRGVQASEETVLLKKPESSGEEVILWPFLKQVIEGGGADLPKVAEPLYKHLSTLPLAQCALGTITDGETVAAPPEGLLAQMEEASQAIQRRLAAFGLAKHYYFESGNEKQAYLPMLMGMATGVTGETAVEHLVGDNPAQGTAMRTGLLYGIDLIDNFFGQSGIVMSRVKGGQPIAPELTRATGAAFAGGTMGLLTAPGQAYVLSDDTVSPEIRSALAGFGAFGTAMAVPINVISAFHEKKSVVERLLKAGIIKPTADELQEYGSMENPENRQKLARIYALNELLTEVGTAASIKAFFGVPFASASILMTERLGISHDWARRMYMAGAPGMENILTGGFMFAKERRLHSIMNNFETHLIDQAADGEAPDKELMEKTFGDPIARWSAEKLLLSPMGPALGLAGLAGMYSYVGWHKKHRNDGASTAHIEASHQQPAALQGIRQPRGQYSQYNQYNPMDGYGSLYGVPTGFVPQSMGRAPTYTPVRTPNGMNPTLLSDPHRFFAQASHPPR